LTSSRRPASSGLLIVAALTSLVLVAAVVVATLMFLKVRKAEAADRDRAAALTAAEQFALRMDDFKGADLQAYVDSITPLLTTKEKTVFTQQFGAFKQVFEAAQKAAKAAGKTKGGEGRIQLAGVAEADPDSATVLVAHDSTLAGQSQALHFRWTVSMRKVSGKWLVDDFVPVS
jgi:hypothetical protein